MRRLVDGGGADADDALLARVFRNVGALPDSDVARRRVLRAVQERASVAGGAAARRAEGSARWRMALAASALLLIGGIAGATIGRSAWDRVFHPAPPRPSIPPVVAPPLAPAAKSAAPSSIEAPAPTMATAPSPSIASAPSAAPTAPVEVPATAHKRPAAPAAPKAIEVPASDETTMDALALRELKRGNSARARVIAEDYLRATPGGMSTESMLYVVVLAADASGDDDVAQVAARYLERYPSGRFAAVVRAIAERAAGRAPMP